MGPLSDVVVVGQDGLREATYFRSANRNKESIILDRKSAAGQETLLTLVDRADVLGENLRTGVLDRLGLGVESLMECNPQRVGVPIADLLSGMYGANGLLAALNEDGDSIHAWLGLS